MTKQLEELATKTDDLSSIFRIYREEWEKKAVYYLHMHALATIYFHTKYYKHFKEKIIMKIIINFENV